MLQAIVNNKLPQLIQLFKSHQIKRAYAFGSVCTNQFTAESDIDLLIAFQDGLDPITYSKTYFELAEELEKLLQRPVDLVTEYSLRNPYFIESVNKTKIPLYES